MTRRRRRGGSGSRSAMQILEEAFQLLRSVDLKLYLIFYLGAVPFSLGLLYFVTDMGRSSLADRDILPWSLAMVGLFLLSCFCKARFSLGLWETLNPISVSKRDRFRGMAALWCVQSVQFPLLLIGSVVILPLGWLIAFFQNATVLALSHSYHGKTLRKLTGTSLRLAHRDWAQNHGILLVFFFLFLFAWLNVVGTCFALAVFAKAFLGVESVFTLSPMVALSNVTFQVGSFLLAHLVISPMMKAAYVLRCFYEESRTTGEDLLSRLAGYEAQRRESRPLEGGVRSGVGALVCALIIFQGIGGIVMANEPVTDKGFETRLSETLEQKKYQWRLSKQEATDDGSSELPWLVQQMKDLAEDVRVIMDDFGEWIETMFERLFDGSGRERSANGDADWKGLKGLGSSLSIGLMVLVVVLVAWIVIRLYLKYRKNGPKGDGEPELAGVVDLQSEDIVASQLPEAEWIRLAREQISKGDGRLAIRALFLATLASLGEKGLVTIARFKSNRDYRRELELKARKNRMLQSAFQSNTTLFEETWYGWHPAGEPIVEEFLKNQETISRESGGEYPDVTFSSRGGVS